MIKRNLPKGGWYLFWFEGSIKWLRGCTNLEGLTAQRYWIFESSGYFSKLVVKELPAVACPTQRMGYDKCVSNTFGNKTYKGFSHLFMGRN